VVQLLFHIKLLNKWKTNYKKEVEKKWTLRTDYFRQCIFINILFSCMNLE